MEARLKSKDTLHYAAPGTSVYRIVLGGWSLERGFTVDQEFTLGYNNEACNLSIKIMKEQRIYQLTHKPNKGERKVSQENQALA